MKRPVPLTVALTCHPATPSTSVTRLTASARIAGAGKLAVRFVLEADMSRVVLPLRAAPERRDELWQRTCFELFVGLPDSEAYCELNFAPSTEWAMYGFVGYRRGMAPIPVRRSPRIALRPMPHGVVLEAVTHLNDLPLPPPGAALRVGLAAVIAESDGRLTYWALTHPAALPDFHHRLGFALQVGAPEQGTADVLASALRNPSS